VDQYVGGVEHAVLHLLYARFFIVTKGDIIKMSKSKKNVVDPDDIIKGYGADVARWFVLSDSPPERDVEWTDAGVNGAWNFQKKVWRVIETTAAPEDVRSGPLSVAVDASGDALELRKLAHRALEKITAGIEAFRFNTSVAQIYELTNALTKYKGQDAARLEALGILVRAIAPFMPHLAEECWSKLGGEDLVYHAPWPQVDPAMLVDDTITATNASPYRVEITPDYRRRRFGITDSDVASRYDITVTARWDLVDAKTGKSVGKGTSSSTATFGAPDGPYGREI